jgi:chemotaxis protein methyltransferase WspC
MQLIENMLRERMGLDACSIGSTLVQRTVRLRMKALGLKKVEDYHRILESSPTEWTELVESVIITETWFFRDGEPFQAMVRLVREEWLPTHPTGKLHLLSIPCSTGEEPYSLVMALQDASIPPDRFEVDAVDISSRVIGRARLGLYGRNSFRGKNLAFRARYFQNTPEGFALSPAVRDSVHFFQGNLLNDEFLPGNTAYDFIFCRNLLIYFDRPTQQRALSRIDRWLGPAGILFVGPAELPLVLEQGFVSANIPMSFACRKASYAAPRAERRPPQRAVAPPRPIVPPRPPVLLPIAPAPAKLARNGHADAKPDPASNGHDDSVLEKARALADAGKLKEAVQTCENHLRQTGPSAQAFYLLGLLRDAAGEPGAMEFYRKALYLEPNHYETLLQMSLLAQKSGDTTQARAFKNRAQRSKSKS